MTTLDSLSKKILGPLGISILAVPLLTAAAVTSQEAPGAGQEVYEAKCATCHGKTGAGDTKAGQMTKTPDLTAVPWKNGTSQAEVEKLVMEGAGKMPAYKDKLSAEEITAVSTFIRKLCGVEEK